MNNNLNNSHMYPKKIEQLVEETISSLDGTRRAEAKPFLLTRVLARMRAEEAVTDNIWTKAGAFLSRPGVAMAGLLLVVLVNAAIIISNMNEGTNAVVQQLSTSKDEFAINVISIYDTENMEP